MEEADDEKATIFVLGCAVSLFAGAAPAGRQRPARDGRGPDRGHLRGLPPGPHGPGAPPAEGGRRLLCYTCHGSAATGATTDVEDGVGYSGSGRSGGTAGALRGGGFSYALIGSNTPSGNGYLGEVPVRSAGAAATSTHSVDESEQMAWGNGAISGTADYGNVIPLRCGSCHDPHGNGNYRILRPMPKDAVVRPGTAGDVMIPDTATKVYTTDNYWQVEDVNAPGFIANISAWCATCHTRYLAPPKAPAPTAAMPSSPTATAPTRRRRARPTASSATSRTAPTRAWGPTRPASPTPTAASAGADSRLLRIDNRGVCQMCHDK